MAAGAALAGDHRRAQQELPRPLGIGRHGAQIVEIALARFRLARLQALLVGDRLLLHELDRHGAALEAVEIEQALGRARHYLEQLVAQIGRVLDAAVEAHAADRIVDMGGVAGEQHAALAEARRHPLVGDVEIAVDDFVGARRREISLHARLDPGVAHDLSSFSDGSTG